MRRLTTLLIAAFVFTCAMTPAAGEDVNSIIKKGGSIGAHFGESTPMAKNYGNPSNLLDSPSSVAGVSEVFMWKVGDGILVIETSFSAGAIKSISYIIAHSGGRERTTLTVKAFNPVTGEMTITIPNNSRH